MTVIVLLRSVANYDGRTANQKLLYRFPESMKCEDQSKKVGNIYCRYKTYPTLRMVGK